jgi:hypothetical protein
MVPAAVGVGEVDFLVAVLRVVVASPVGADFLAAVAILAVDFPAAVERRPWTYSTMASTPIGP